MANNRLWAVCSDDNEAEMLIKYYPGPGGWGGKFCDRDEFFAKHEDCKSNQGCGENILFITEQDDRVGLYDFRRENGEGFKIYLKGQIPENKKHLIHA